jgi:hypothetical protein
MNAIQDRIREMHMYWFHDGPYGIIVTYLCIQVAKIDLRDYPNMKYHAFMCDWNHLKSIGVYEERDEALEAVCDEIDRRIKQSQRVLDEVS